MLSPKLWPRAAATIYCTFGARGVWLRAAHEARRVTNRFRAQPRYAPGPARPEGTHPFQVDGRRLVAASDVGAAVRRGEKVAGGKHQAFRWGWEPLPDDAEDWLRHPTTGRIRCAHLPWWKTPHLDPDFGDIKELWEPARFAWVYDLVRAWLLTGEDRFVEAFHERFRQWVESSPPFHGPHWSCGQETAIRAAALLYAEGNLGGAPASTARDMERIRTVLAASGERIADAMGYAVSQRNNHAISEAAGLIMLGVRFLGSHPEADGWLQDGRRWLERLVSEQFACDGWYIQHSFIYQRLALDQLVLAERALRSVGERLARSAVDRIRVSAELLTAVIDGPNGSVPNHGASDGAFVHPITLAGYRDFRPVLTAVCALWGFALPEDISPDDEVVAWLGIDAPPAGPPLEDGVCHGVSGWASARIRGTQVFLRAGRYRSRPGHLDALHLDVRINSREVVVDPGTYAYNAPPPWRNGLAGASVHNGPVVDGRDPGIRGPRFLWLAWPAAEITAALKDSSGLVLEAEIPGRIRRTVRVEPRHVTVRDELLDPSADRFSVLWTLHPDADFGAVDSSGELRVAEAEEMGIRGWYSPAYGVRLPTQFIEVLAGRDRTMQTVIRLPGKVDRPAITMPANDSNSRSTDR